MQRLQVGNQRFALEMTRLKNEDLLQDQSVRDRRLSLLDGQSPFAIILGCSDSRVPAEIVFDQGLGDLFVVRVAGNIIAPSLVESVEFSAEYHRAKLVVVLGHTQCGAVSATFESLLKDPQQRHGPYRSIVERIRPTFETLIPAFTHDLDIPKSINSWDKTLRQKLLQQATRANIRASVNHLRHGSRTLEELTESAGLLIVGAEYSLESGLVDFFDLGY